MVRLPLRVSNRNSVAHYDAERKAILYTTFARFVAHILHAIGFVALETLLPTSLLPVLTYYNLVLIFHFWITLLNLKEEASVLFSDIRMCNLDNHFRFLPPALIQVPQDQISRDLPLQMPIDLSKVSK